MASKRTGNSGEASAMASDSTFKKTAASRSRGKVVIFSINVNGETISISGSPGW